MKPLSPFKMMIYASLCAALTAAGALIAIPVGPVPIVLQNFFVMITGLLLGSRWGLASVGIYLLAGVMGFPVFAGGTGGIGRIMGPTGGYLIGYLPAVWLIGWISHRPKPAPLFDLIAMLCGSLIIYLFGLSWLKLITGMNLWKSLAVGMIPFLPGDAVKIAAALAVVPIVRRTIGELPPTGH
ncbi:MAG: biotin transporter BioY [Thermodesulfobacteriota bacterium]